MKFEFICASGDASTHYEVKDCFPIKVKDFMDYVFANRDKHALRMLFFVSNNVYESYQNFIEFEREEWRYDGKWFIKSQSPCEFQEKFNEKTVVKAYHSDGYGHDHYWLILKDQ